jgi:AraC-like DNA-binding protein
MNSEIINIPSITRAHELFGYDKPAHPLVSLVDFKKIKPEARKAEVSYQMEFYVISCKGFKGALKYGRSYYDFEEGTLTFTSPNQVISATPDMDMHKGWGLFFHPDLIHGTALGAKINDYSFFHYDINEALHASEEELSTLLDCAEKIRKEYAQNMDKHTRGLIVSNIELLLNYCDRFYDRQFFTRAKVNNDMVQRFELLLSEYFSQGTLIESGLPDVKYFASGLNLSPNYLSDILKKSTGKTTQEHIHLQLTEKAKSLLWGTNQSISEIAYSLGFEHPSHFDKIFKSKTGITPSQFRNAN